MLVLISFLIFYALTKKSSVYCVCEPRSYYQFLSNKDGIARVKKYGQQQARNWYGCFLRYIKLKANIMNQLLRQMADISNNWKMVAQFFGNADKLIDRKFPVYKDIINSKCGRYSAESSAYA